jgi:4'-phosphopantetheinyl transferase
MGRELVAGGCTVFWARLADARPADADLLDPIERERRAAYRHDVDRDRFTTGVALTRVVLGHHLGVDPRAVPLRRDCPSCGRPHGRPRLPDGGPPHLSISHAGGLVAVAVTPGPATGIGVDVEPSTADVDGLADQVLSAAERVTVGAAPDAVRRTWVRKEALLKATGDGLTVPMNSFSADHLDAGVHLHELTWPGRSYVAYLAVLAAGEKPPEVRERAA